MGSPLLDLFLCGFLVADVGKDSHDPNELAGVSVETRAGNNQDGQACAVPSNKLHLVPVGLAAPAPIVGGLDDGVLVFGDDGLPMLARKVLGCVAQQARSRRVDKGKASLGILHNNALTHALNDVLVELLELPQFLLVQRLCCLCSLSFGDVIDRTLHHFNLVIVATDILDDLVNPSCPSVLVHNPVFPLE